MPFLRPLLGLLLGGLLSYAGIIAVEYNEGDETFLGAGLHGAIGANGNHNFQPLFGNPTKWVFTGGITEAEKIGGANDKLDLDGSVRHDIGVPGHNEVANNKAIPIKTGVQAGVGGVVSGPKPAIIPPSARYVKHKDHFDYSFNTGSVLVNPNNRDIESYTLLVTGGHNTEAPPEPFTVALSSSISPNTLYGSGAITIDPSDNRMGLALAILGISPGDILSAMIRQGTPDTPGANIFDLTPSLFRDLGGVGTSRLLFDVFPATYLADLESGNVFFELASNSDRITGQVVPVSAVFIPEPDTFGLAAFALLIVYSLGRRIGSRARLQ